MTELVTFDIHVKPRGRKPSWINTNMPTLALAKDVLPSIKFAYPNHKVWVVERTSKGERIVA